MKKLFIFLMASILAIAVNAQTKVYTNGGVFYMIDTQTSKQYEGIATNVLVVRSTTSSDDFYFRGVNGWLDAQFLNITDIQDELGTPYSLETFKTFYDNLNVTTIVNNEDYYLKVAKGEVPGSSIVTKFGRNGAVGTTLSFIAIGGNYQTPTTTQSLEILSTDANDNSVGTGAQKVIIQGLDNSWNIQLDTIALNGLTPVALNKQFTRVYRGWIYESGSYATTTTPSHVGQITLRGAGAGATWFVIDTYEETATGFGIGQTQIGAYTIQSGYSAYLLSKTFSIEANKPASLYFFKRDNAQDVVAPYSGTMRLFEQNDGIEVPFTVVGKAPLIKINGVAELGFFAKTAVGTASVSVEFQLLVIKD